MVLIERKVEIIDDKEVITERFQKIKKEVMEEETEKIDIEKDK